MKPNSYHLNEILFVVDDHAMQTKIAADVHAAASLALRDACDALWKIAQGDRSRKGQPKPTAQEGRATRIAIARGALFAIHAQLRDMPSACERGR